MEKVREGYIRISDELTIFPSFTFEQFKETTYYKNQDGIRIIYLEEQQVIENRKYIVSLFFRNETIYMVSLVCCDQEFSEVDEGKRKLLHDDILKEWGLVEQKEYIWGRIYSDYDNRSNIGSINIVYFSA